MFDTSAPSASIGAAIGSATLAAGLLLLAFAGFQLWGTGMAEARAQEELSQTLAATLDRRDPSPDASGAPLWPVDEPGLGPAEPSDAALVIGQPDGQAPVLPTDDESGAERAAADQHPVVPIADPASPPKPLEIGQPMARLWIPAIGVDKTVVEGTTREALRTGPGHYLGTARPGQPGNVAIAGHRTTYGAPFHDIDALQPGDPIIVETEDGVFTYRVEAQPLPGGGTSGHRIVAPEDVHVIADRGDHRLTLTACHPLYSARQRIIVTAILDQPESAVSDPAVDTAVATFGDDTAPSTQTSTETAAPVTQVGWPSPGGADRTVSVRVPVPLPVVAAEQLPISTSTSASASASTEMAAGPGLTSDAALEDDLGWQPQHGGATAVWAALTALVATAAWVAGRQWRRVPAYLLAAPTFTLCLLTCFGHLDRLIPAS